MRGVSEWNFDIEELKAQAALVRVYFFFAKVVTTF